MTLHIPDFHTTAFDEITRKSVSALDREVRQGMVRDLLYPYNRFLDTQELISQWHRPFGDDGAAEVGDLGLLIGESGNGKSYMLKSFYQRAMVAPTENRMKFPIIYIEVVKNWKAGGFAKALLSATGKKSAKGSRNVDELGLSAVERLIEYETTFIIIDDAHFLFETKRYYDDHYGLLKNILDARFANILLAGLPHLKKAVKGEFQLGRRSAFNKTLRKFDAATEARHYQAFLQGVDERLPFAKESGLATPAVVEQLFMASSGSVGLTMSIVQRAARLAFTAMSACVMRHHLKQAIEDVLLADDEALELETL